jgi:hypothetical protein
MRGCHTACHLAILSLSFHSVVEGCSTNPAQASPVGEKQDLEAARKAEDPYGVEFGYCVRTIDDVDGLGRRDFAVGAPAYIPSGGDHWVGRMVLFSTERRCVISTVQAPAEAWCFGAHIEVIGDVDRDGHPDLLVGDDDTNASEYSAIVSTSSGKILYTLPFNAASIASIHDVDEDGCRDLAVASCDRIRLLSGASATELGEIPFPWITDSRPLLPDRQPWMQKPQVKALGDVDRDGKADVLVRDRSEDRKAYLLLQIPAGEWRILEFPFDPMGERSDWNFAPIHDVDSDGWLDLWSSEHEHVEDSSYAAETALLSLRTGRVVSHWKESSSWANGWQCIPIGKVDTDDAIDFVVSRPDVTFQSEIAVFSGWTEQVLWRTPQPEYWTELTGLGLDLLDDEDGDGIPEIVLGVGDYDGNKGPLDRNEHVDILSGKTGELLWTIGVNEIPELAISAR